MRLRIAAQHLRLDRTHARRQGALQLCAYLALQSGEKQVQDGRSAQRSKEPLDVHQHRLGGSQERLLRCGRDGVVRTHDEIDQGATLLHRIHALHQVNAQLRTEILALAPFLQRILAG